MNSDKYLSKKFYRQAGKSDQFMVVTVVLILSARQNAMKFVEVLSSV
jgi:hypothetical protein